MFLHYGNKDIDAKNKLNIWLFIHIIVLLHKYTLSIIQNKAKIYE